MSNLSDNAVSVSEALMKSRRTARAFTVFPGAPLGGREEAYAVQERSIKAWPHAIGGWKVGFVPPEHQGAFGAGMLAGPMFANRITVAGAGERVAAPVFRGGFLSAEGEWAFRLTKDLGDRRSEDDIADICALHGGVELAASPFEPIDTAGPLPVVADFGNNNGFVLGPEIAHWRDRAWSDLAISMQRNGVAGASGHAGALPACPLQGMAFLAAHLAERGRTLRAGDIVTTGNVAGAMRPPVGDVLRFEFADAGWIELVLTEESPG